MKTLKKIKIIVPALALAAVLIAGYTISVLNPFNLHNFFAVADTLDLITSEIPYDASGMFNERGYYKSNSISYDENEIINDYNGNLMYSIPLYYFKGKGDLNVDLKLTYNGSVNHQIISADSTKRTDNVSFPQYNMTAPEWIISLNGMAIQLLNFETKFFTQRDVNHEAENDEVRLLATGYHLTDRMKEPGPSFAPDAINIMQGDGSVMRLENTDNSVNTYTGIYYTTTKKDYTRAQVDYLSNDTNTPDYYRMRSVKLSKGDGISYYYTETPVAYYDYPMPTPVSARINTPQSLLLTRIEDRFGNAIYILYDHSRMGRPIVDQILVSWKDLPPIKPIFPGQNGFQIFNSLKGNYHFLTVSNYSFGADGDHRPIVSDISNTVGETIEIEYSSPYTRNANNLFYYLNVGSDQMDVSLTNLRRLSSFTNYYGGKKTYQYYGDNSITLNYTVTPPNIIKSTGDNYKGQGRDAFFANMVSSKSVSENDNPIRTEAYQYYYIDPEPDAISNPIDENDYYSTTKTVTSSKSNNNSTPSYFRSEKEYKNYEAYKSYHNLENPDWGGETKLLSEKFYKENEPNAYKIVGYQFIKGDMVDSAYKGSFLDTAITETYSGVSKKTRFEYEHETNFPPDINATSLYPIKKITQTDPLNNKTITEYHLVYENSLVYQKGDYFNSSYTYSVPFYSIYQPKTVEKKDTSDNLLYKQTNSYAGAGDTSSCYFGQLLNTKIYNAVNTNLYLQTTYEYCKRDTTGIHLYGVFTEFKPGTEGNLKKTIDPNGNITCYYYHPISSLEETGSGIPSETDNEGIQYDNPSLPPKISYKKVFENGNVTLISSVWQDSRLPSRVDNYVNSNYKLTAYNLYDDAGNLVKNVSNNKFLSTLAYDPIDRVVSVTLPNDFNNSVVHDSTVYDTIYYPVEKTVSSNWWGQKDFESSSGPHFENWPCNIENDEFMMEVNYDDGAYTQRIYPLMIISDGDLNNLDSIEYAYFEFYPTRFWYEGVGDSADHAVLPVLVAQTNIDTPALSGVSMDLNNLNCTWDGNCNFPAYYNQYDVKNLLKSHIIDYSNVFEGFLIRHRLVENWHEPMPPHYVALQIGYCIDPQNCGSWGGLYAPVIKIKGICKKILTRIVKVYERGTMRYIYDDANNKVTVLSKLYPEGSSQRDKKTETIFDGFYKPVQTTNYFDHSDNNNKAVFYSDYNYLDQKGRTLDARNDSTMYSYNEYGTLSKTKNCDESFSVTSESYDDTLTTHWGLYTGFIHKQVFTDETGRNFEKYYDAVGNLLREVKYISAISDPDSPYDPDSTFQGNDDPGNIELYTDYRYDNMYRVTGVYTPNFKTIEYTYDGYGRQASRTTPDAGVSYYSYDKNGNLTYSQDANQRTRAGNIYTFRTYDGLNRLVTLGETRLGNPYPNFQELDGSTVLSEGDNPPAENDYLIINVYDTLANASVITFTPPYDYGTANNTKGNLTVTAYRTRNTDSWNFKYYRYDARGRIIRMWHYTDINGGSWKVMNYSYNSANQVTGLTYMDSYGNPDFNQTDYIYDDAGRLKDVEVYKDSRTGMSNFCSYSYNPNSQVYYHNFNDSSLSMAYLYNNRNWVQASYQAGGNIMEYALLYLKNGNIRTQQIQGDYNDNFTDNTDALNFTYTYDVSNRLLKANRDSGTSATRHDLINTYDKDGNIMTMKRYGATGSLADNFSYTYFSGTNRLAKVTGSSEQYSYDNNGNMTKDELNQNYNFIYDHRNLLIEFRGIRNEGDEGTNYQTKYYYDEAGNRIRKMIWKYLGSEPNPVFQEDNPYVWQLITDEFYVRDASGKEIAIYNGSSLDQWNIWGLDNAGKVIPDEDRSRFFYLKDHLGSIRAIVNESNAVVSAQDYDMWGNLLENRSFSSDTNRYKFTNKERDNESTYDYFGARYYDSRIGRWGGVEPLLARYFSITPYAYAVCSPVKLADINGMDVYISGLDAWNVWDKLRGYVSGFTIGFEGGKLTIEGDPLTEEQIKNLSAAEQEIYNAITKGEKIVNLVTTKEHNFVSTERFASGEELVKTNWFVGGGWGDHVGNAALQYINYDDLQQMENLGISSIGFSIAHELIEAYWGVKYNLAGGVAHTIVSSEKGPLPEASHWSQYIAPPEDCMGEIIRRGYLVSPSGERIKIWEQNLTTNPIQK